MSHYIKRGNTYWVTPEKALDIRPNLPAANYVARINPENGQFYLEMVDEFEREPKVYGNTTRHAKRIMETFKSRPFSTGVLLAGEKGSGKTLLARTLGQMCVEQDMACIIVNSPMAGPAFNKFIQDIDIPAMVLFDEFEKVYDDDTQEQMLTLLDGVFPSQKLFVLTCNNKWKIDQNMLNRPGRLFYMLEFDGLDAAFIRDYCEDKLNRKDRIDSVCNVAVIFRAFNFDMLKALVEEMNRYDETAQEALQMLNIKPDYKENSEYTVEMLYDGKPVTGELLDTTEWRGNPLYNGRFNIEHARILGMRRDGSFEVDMDKSDKDDPFPNFVYTEFDTSNLVRIDAQNGGYVYKKDKFTVVLKRKKEERPNVYDIAY